MCLDLKIWAKYPIIRRIYLALEKFLSTVNGIHGDGWNELKNNGMLELLCSLKKKVGGIIQLASVSVLELEQYVLRYSIICEFFIYRIMKLVKCPREEVEVEAHSDEKEIED